MDFEVYFTYIENVSGIKYVSNFLQFFLSQLFVEQQESIVASQTEIANHALTLSGHETLIQTNVAAIASNLAAIGANGARIDGNVASIQSLQAVADSYNLFRSNQVGFYGETRCCEVNLRSTFKG